VPLRFLNFLTRESGLCSNNPTFSFYRGGRWSFPGKP
jgi:hypothetical protein